MLNKKHIDPKVLIILTVVMLLFIFQHRYTNYTLSIVSNTDSVIAFSTEDVILEQTWQPRVKWITGVSVPYEVDEDVSAIMRLDVYSDDYSELLIGKSEKIELYAGDVGTIEYSFDRVGVIPGERYHFVLTYIDVETQGQLNIKAGNNYAGCSVAEISQGKAAALDIICVKNNKIFWLFGVMFPVAAISLFLMLTFDKKWEETVGCSVLIEGIILYVCGLFGHLVSGIYLIFGLAILLTVYVYINVKKKQLEWHRLLSVGVWIYYIFFFIIIITCLGKRIAGRDQLALWAMVPRDMFYYDGFCNHVNSGILDGYMHYPPLTGIIEYLYVYLNGVFSDEVVFIAFQTLMLGICMILFVPVNKHKRNIIPAMIATVCLPVLFLMDISSAILIEPILGALLMYVLISYFLYDFDLFNVIRMLIGLIALALVKETGFILAIMIAFAILIDCFVKKVVRVPGTKKHILFVGLATTLIVISFFSWNIYVNMPVKQVAYDKSSGVVSEAHDVNQELSLEYDNSSVSRSGISVEKLIELVKGEGDDYQYDVIDAFIVFLFEDQSFEVGAIKVSYFGVIVIICIICWLASLFEPKQENKAVFVRYSIMLIMISLGFCLCLLILYMFAFPQNEAVQLAQINRYLSPCVYGFFSVLLYLLYGNVSKNDEVQKQSAHKYIAIGLSAILLTNIPISQLVVEEYERENYANDEIVYGYSDITEILRSIGKRGEKVYFICEDGGEFMEYIFRNEIFPMISSQGYSNIVSTQDAANIMTEYYGKDGLSWYQIPVVTMEEWKTILMDYEYLVIFHSDRMFVESYGELFEDVATIGDGTIYEVQKDESDVLLKFIGQTGIKKYR